MAGFPHPAQHPAHWRSPLLDSLTKAGQTILNFNIFSSATTHCDVFKTGKANLIIIKRKTKTHKMK
jgi:hypothetical protein